MNVSGKDIELTNCALCGSADYDFVMEASDQSMHVPGRFSLVKCRSCGLVYVNPRPTEAGIKEYYPSEKYFSETSKILSQKEFLQRIKGVVRRNAPGYSEKNNRLERLVGSGLRLFLKNQVGIVAPYADGGRVLDVGCGNGNLIAWMKNYGWDVYGVEVDDSASKVAESKGLRVFRGYLKEAQFPSGHFDVVIMNHVLEHIHSPGKILDECHRILKRGGWLILGVPNFGCYDREMFGSFWFAMEVPRHLFHFTQETLGALLEHHGFYLERWRRRFPHPLYAFLSFGYYKKLRRPGAIESFALLVRALMVKPTRWLFSAHREYYDEILEVYTQKR